MARVSEYSLLKMKKEFIHSELGEIARAVLLIDLVFQLPEKKESEVSFRKEDFPPFCLQL